MSEKTDELLDAIRTEERMAAIDNLAKQMVESSKDIWNALVRFCGEREASLTVTCLLQRAAEAGAVEAVRFKTDDPDDFEIIVLKHGFDDENSFTIGDGVWLRVAEKSNARLSGPQQREEDHE